MWQAWLLGLCLFPWIAGISAVHAQGSPGDGVRLGAVNPLTGKLANHGQEILCGIETAVKEVNARGGIGGRRVQLLSRDDQSHLETAINQVQDLIYREKVTALTGGYVDSLVGPISQLASKAHVPYVASASLQRDLTLRGKNPFFFRISHLNGVTEPLCRFLPQVLVGKKAAIVHAATPGATEFSQTLFQCLRDGGMELVLVEKFRPGIPDFSPLLLKMRSLQVDVLISAGFFSDHLILVRQIREQNVPLTAYIGPWGVAYPEFIQQMGMAAENLVGLSAWQPDCPFPGTEEESRRFTEKFRATYGREPTSTVMHGYTSARVLLEAMGAVAARGAPLDGPHIAQALRSLDITVPMGRVQFDANGDPLHYRQVVVQIQNGRLVPIFPAQRAHGSWIPMTVPAH
ncbi:ABC transporter substrate-binding protein [Desulfosoma caldarium]|uniref:Amino acid/amide ABC transporter substrate-binding protein (HAAT family) n=1 Tax=Desulfosoma caldarium TaxID=610254 RepID=A0A3N1UR34_9BACT|nr:ABC transporter substrate-binding protein [Desulfosoma caldarium]ROQ91007.1 amino acid/amide ABC transporter substrate-binding protein (HAAT family) [Desulfosoma caldarium]